MTSLADFISQFEPEKSQEFRSKCLTILKLNDIERVEDLEGTSVEGIVASKCTSVAVSGGMSGFLSRLLQHFKKTQGGDTASGGNAGVADAIRLACYLALARCLKLPTRAMRHNTDALRDALGLSSTDKPKHHLPLK